MTHSPSIAEFWEEFCRSNLGVDTATPYQAWHFGNTRELADELAALVLAGKKRATASIEYEYLDRPEDAPVKGGYSVVTDFDGHPKCVVRTTELREIPFNEVDADFAFDEGEGDQSLDYWRSVHWDYFSRQCMELSIQPSETMPVICERFELLYPTFNDQ
jgi:uncharacterized protein YhfF